MCGGAPYVGKTKTHFDIGSITVKANIELSGKNRIPQQLFHDNYCLNGYLGIDYLGFYSF